MNWFSGTIHVYISGGEEFWFNVPFPVPDDKLKTILDNLAAKGKTVSYVIYEPSPTQLYPQ